MLHATDSPDSVCSPPTLDELALQRFWLPMALNGHHQRSACVDGPERLRLTANRYRAGLMSHLWFPEAGWQLSLNIEELTASQTKFVLCLHSGIEYTLGGFENWIEFEFTIQGLRIYTQRNVIFDHPRSIHPPMSVKLFCSLKSELTLLLDERPLHSFQQDVLRQGAKLFLYAHGAGEARIERIELLDARDPWHQRHSDPVPRSEYPNPQMLRDDWWQSLNGDWEFLFDPQANFTAEQLAAQTEFPLKIKVPFPWQSILSGVREPSYTGVAWYRRRIHLPNALPGPGQRIVLRFGACDYHTKVYLNGKPLGEHTGGFDPFEFNLTPALVAGRDQQLLVRVEDPHDFSKIPVGKQGTWYVRSSGLWQSVTLELRAEYHISLYEIATDLAHSLVRIRGWLNAAPPAPLKLKISIGSDGKILTETTLEIPDDIFSADIPLANPRLWSPEQPFLYDLHFHLAISPDDYSDHLESYFGFREIRAEGRRLLLNGKPLYLRGVLNQCFYPTGLYNYPNVDMIRTDVLLARQFGINMFRVHIKVDDPQLYFWMDHLGLLAWQDVPCFDDRGYEVSSEQENRQLDFPTGSAKANLLRDATRMVEELRNHPSVIIWDIFNEGWGLGGMYKEHAPFDELREMQDYLRAMVGYFRRLDPARLVVDDSPCEEGYSHVDTDILEYHFYANHIAHAKAMTYQEEYLPWKNLMENLHADRCLCRWYAGCMIDALTPEQLNKPIVISEYGPWPGMPWHEQDLSIFIKFLTHQIMLNAEISGYVLTEFQDIEWEINGLLAYDRAQKDFGFELARMVFNPLLPLADIPPCVVAERDRVEIPVFATNYTAETVENLQLEIELQGIDSFGFRHKVDKGEVIDLPRMEFGLHPLGTREVELKGGFSVYHYRMRMLHESAVIAENYFLIEDQPDALVVRNQPGMIALEHFELEAQHVEQFKLDGQIEVLGFFGNGNIIIPLENLNPKAFVAEISTCPLRVQQFQHESTRPLAEVYLNETKVYEFEIPRARSDFRGMLSQVHSYRSGMYGELVTVLLASRRHEPHKFDKLLIKTSSGSGMVIYSNRAGRFPTPPMLLF